MLAQNLVAHCSPTLSGLKTGNLFNYCLPQNTDAEKLINEWNELLALKGVHLFVMAKKDNKVLIYVFRPSMLKQDLQKEGVSKFLSAYNYNTLSQTMCVAHLKKRIAETDGFPHEIGLFLGYPLADVKGFIENCGQNYKCTGYWKVYENETDTMRLFQKYTKCKDVYTRLFANRTKSVLQLTVAV